MKKLIIILFGLVSCNNNNLQADKSPVSSQDTSIYNETAVSKFEIISEKDEIGYTYKSVESNFKPVSIQLKKFDDNQYFAHIITTTKRATSLEGQERNIKVEIKSFDNPMKTIIQIDKNCDNIDFKNHTYKTVKYGCCGSLAHYEIFDYQNKQIIMGDDKIITGFIPNSRLIIYLGFTRQTNDSAIVGKLHYSTTGGSKFEIVIKSKRKKVMKCDILGEISLKSSKIDKFDAEENEYTLWSLDKNEDEKSINNLLIHLNIHPSEPDCLDKKDSKFVNIPIIQGKPFGKDTKIQEIILD
jgi:hypothetical protein